MVMMVHYIGILPAQIESATLDDQWRTHVKAVEELKFRHWIGAPEWLDERPHKRLDWGTVLYEVTAEDLADLTGQEDLRLPPLREGERYAAVWVECY